MSRPCTITRQSQVRALALDAANRKWGKILGREKFTRVGASFYATIEARARVMIEEAATSGQIGKTLL
jgi:hypothetical protein